MKVGILSMQRVINYGSFLQAYALKRILENIGHEVYFIDIKKDSANNMVVARSKIKHILEYAKKIDRYILKRIQHEQFIKARYYMFTTIWQPIIGVTSPVDENVCDMIVIGSDEVFNCCQCSRWKSSMQLFGDTSVPAITYAASCGYTSYYDVRDKGIVLDIVTALNKLKAISVRDNNTYQFVHQLIKRFPEQHMDPVLIYDWKREVKVQNQYKNYILNYAYDNRIMDDKEIKSIKAFARKYKKKLISFGVYQRWCDKNVLCSPFELLSYFDGADYVITDTFHGTVISIKRNKQFATIIRETNVNKLKDLLSKFNLQNREVTDIKDLDSVIRREIDYKKINQKIAFERKRAIIYLETNLSVN